MSLPTVQNPKIISLKRRNLHTRDYLPGYCWSWSTTIAEESWSLKLWMNILSTRWWTPKLSQLAQSDLKALHTCGCCHVVVRPRSLISPAGHRVTGPVFDSWLPVCLTHPHWPTIHSTGFGFRRVNWLSDPLEHVCVCECWLLMNVFVCPTSFYEWALVHFI